MLCNLYSLWNTTFYHVFEFLDNKVPTTTFWLVGPPVYTRGQKGITYWQTYELMPNGIIVCQNDPKHLYKIFMKYPRTFIITLQLYWAHENVSKLYCRLYFMTVSDKYFTPFTSHSCEPNYTVNMTPDSHSNDTLVEVSLGLHIQGLPRWIYK